tara:strand:- start:12068 stop:12928 length:861 start_codon:yes stop_codon:yes gene_type:complete
MLGLGNSITSGSVVAASGFSPIDITKLVGWWDFTDTKVMYSDAGSTEITHGDAIYRIDNKAYTLQSNDNTALGSFLQQGTSGNRPAFHSSGYAVFSANDFLKASKDTGNVAVNKLSDTTLNGIDMTVFYVVSELGSASADEYLLHITTANTSDRMSIYLVDSGSSDRWRWHHQDNTDRTNTIMNVGVNATNSKELYTVHLDSTSASSFYRNGDTSDGVTNGSADNHDIDLSVNNVNVAVRIGVGAAASAGNYLNGLVHEVIVYDKALSSDEITQVQDFLINKHSIS